MKAAQTHHVQAVTRALEVLTVVARGGGQMAISDIAVATGLPLATVHRLLRTMVDTGYMRQLPSRRYALDAGLIPLGEAAGAVLDT